MLRGYITNVYGPNNAQAKTYFLNNLQNIAIMHLGSHSIIEGDFNIITSLEDKKGGIRRLDMEGEIMRNI